MLISPARSQFSPIRLSRWLTVDVILSKEAVSFLLIIAILWIGVPTVSLNEDSLSGESWQKLSCFEGPLPSRDSTELFPQVFISDVRKGSSLDIHVSQFPEYSEQDQADIICSSDRVVHSQIPIWMPCPFLYRKRDGIKVHWTFKAFSAKSGLFNMFEDPAKRAQNKGLFLGYLKNFNQGVYNCTATAGQQKWSETTKLTMLEHGWQLDWTGPNANYKSYVLFKQRGSIKVLPFEELSWLQENVEAVEEAI